MRKIELTLADDEVPVVMAKPFWQHIADAYQHTGATCTDVDEMMAWYNIADSINEQVKKYEEI